MGRDLSFPFLLFCVDVSPPGLQGKGASSHSLGFRIYWAINMYCGKRRDLEDGVTRRREIVSQRRQCLGKLEMSLESGQRGGPSRGLLKGNGWSLRSYLGAESLLSALHFCKVTVCAQELCNERLHFTNILGHTWDCTTVLASLCLGFMMYPPPLNPATHPPWALSTLPIYSLCTKPRKGQGS